MALRESGMVKKFECSQRVNVLMDQLLDKHLSDYAVNWNKMQPKENQSKPASNLKNNCQNVPLYNIYLVSQFPERSASLPLVICEAGGLGPGTWRSPIFSNVVLVLIYIGAEIGPPA